MDVLLVLLVIVIAAVAGALEVAHLVDLLSGNLPTQRPARTIERDEVGALARVGVGGVRSAA